MELSVIEKQRVALRRINHGQQLHHLDMADSDHGQQLRWRSTINQQRHSCSATSAAEEDWQWNSVSKKRKAEFEIEEKIQIEAEEEEEAAPDENSDITTSGNTKASEAQKQDYIHVRARRGQATDSHSLAERARREKLSKKMKCLQDLVPGCNKVTGKAGMLDEIINYVHSLQKQVEFLSTKLATINPRIDFNIDNFFAKEIPAFEFQYNPMQPGSSNCMANVGMDQISSRKEGSCCLPIPEVFLDSSCISQLQQLSGWESDWQNQFPAGFQ